ncbi:MAG: 50S ribosomal protein L9 [Enterobacterales bacterium]
MNVILIYKIKKLGLIGDQVNVKSGYARNYLFPFKKAVQATNENLKYFSNIKKSIKYKIEILKKNNIERLNKINNLKKITIKSKSGLNGKLFGSISAIDIAKKINANGININKNEIKLTHGLLKNIGLHNIKIQISKDIIIDFIVNIISLN